MAEITDEQIAELRRLHEAATPPERLSVMRYAHGGGRVCAEPRDLVADFYEEADRECWIAARNALPALLSRLERAEKERDEARKEAVAAVSDWGGAVSAGQREEDLRASIATLEKALRAYVNAGIGQSTDYEAQHSAYRLAGGALRGEGEKP